jgi:hypothetical protein
MRDLTETETKSVAGGITVVSSSSSTVKVKSVVVQKNGETIKSYTRIIRR